MFYNKSKLSKIKDIINVIKNVEKFLRIETEWLSLIKVEKLPNIGLHRFNNSNLIIETMHHERQ